MGRDPCTALRTGATVGTLPWRHPADRAQGRRFVDGQVGREALKLAVVLGFPFRYSAFDEVLDGVVYTVAASLGFGLLENLAYSATDVATGLARALTAVPMHAIAAGVMGYFVGRARFVSDSGA